MLPRLLSTLVMAPVFLASIWFGAPYFEIVVGILAIIAATELLGVTAGSWRSIGALAAVLLYAISLASSMVGMHSFFWGAAVISAVISLAVSRAENGNRVWGGGGVLYLLIANYAVFEIRDWVPAGRDWIFWFFAIVWAADIGAYLVGKTIGGPKLAPTISPGKTWSGTIGGLAAALAVSAVFSTTIFKEQGIVDFLLLGTVVGVASQLGDLLESYFKRMNDVKDSGAIIPGHGGVLDRIDGVLLAAPVAWFLIPLVTGTPA